MCDNSSGEPTETAPPTKLSKLLSERYFWGDFLVVLFACLCPCLCEYTPHVCSKCPWKPGQEAGSAGADYRWLGAARHTCRELNLRPLHDSWYIHAVRIVLLSMVIGACLSVRVSVHVCRLDNTLCCHSSYVIHHFFFLTHFLSGPELTEKPGTAGPGALGIYLPVSASSAQEFQAHAIIFRLLPVRIAELRSSLPGSPSQLRVAYFSAVFVIEFLLRAVPSP